MKLEVSFQKRANGSIGYKIEVIEGGDYPTSSIFNNCSGFDPENWEIGERDHVIYDHYESNAQGATEEVDLIIARIKEKLNEWRNIEIPSDYKIEI